MTALSITFIAWVVLTAGFVAVMVYRYQLYPINLYIWPGSDAGTQAHVFVQEGYHLAHWSAAGVTYWVVTDAGAAELNGFISNLRAQAES